MASIGLNELKWWSIWVMIYNLIEVMCFACLSQKYIDQVTNKKSSTFSYTSLEANVMWTVAYLAVHC